MYMTVDEVKTTETYEHIHSSGTYEVTAKYVGSDTLIDVIKSALKRDFELRTNGNNEKCLEP